MEAPREHAEQPNESFFTELANLYERVSITPLPQDLEAFSERSPEVQEAYLILLLGMLFERVQNLNERAETLQNWLKENPTHPATKDLAHFQTTKVQWTFYFENFLSFPNPERNQVLFRGLSEATPFSLHELNRSLEKHDLPIPSTPYRSPNSEMSDKALDQVEVAIKELGVHAPPFFALAFLELVNLKRWPLFPQNSGGPNLLKKVKDLITEGIGPQELRTLAQISCDYHTVEAYQNIWHVYPQIERYFKGGCLGFHKALKRWWDNHGFDFGTPITNFLFESLVDSRNSTRENPRLFKLFSSPEDLDAFIHFIDEIEFMLAARDGKLPREPSAIVKLLVRGQAINSQLLDAVNDASAQGKELAWYGTLKQEVADLVAGLPLAEADKTKLQTQIKALALYGYGDPLWPNCLEGLKRLSASLQNSTNAMRVRQAFLQYLHLAEQPARRIFEDIDDFSPHPLEELDYEAIGEALGEHTLQLPAADPTEVNPWVHFYPFFKSLDWKMPPRLAKHIFLKEDTGDFSWEDCQLQGPADLAEQVSILPIALGTLQAMEQLEAIMSAASPDYANWTDIMERLHRGIERLNERLYQNCPVDENAFLQKLLTAARSLLASGWVHEGSHYEDIHPPEEGRTPLKQDPFQAEWTWLENAHGGTRMVVLGTAFQQALPTALALHGLNTNQLGNGETIFSRDLVHSVYLGINVALAPVIEALRTQRRAVTGMLGCGRKIHSFEPIASNAFWPFIMAFGAKQASRLARPQAWKVNHGDTLALSVARCPWGSKRMVELCQHFGTLEAGKFIQQFTGSAAWPPEVAAAVGCIMQYRFNNPHYEEGSFRTTFDYLTAKRILVGDWYQRAKDDPFDLDGARDAGRRTDILGQSDEHGFETWWLLNTLATHKQHRGWFAPIADEFFTQIDSWMDTYELRPLVSQSAWVNRYIVPSDSPEKHLAMLHAIEALRGPSERTTALDQILSQAWSAIREKQPEIQRSQRKQHDAHVNW